MIGAIAAGPIASDVEQASYTIIHTDGAIEWREYAPAIVAETTVSGERKEAINEGFKRIADYIFGNNRSNQSIAMTAPVLQQPNEKIAMTAPVLQEQQKQGWRVQFVMPASYRMDTLPTPVNSAVQLREVPRRVYAAITFSGMADSSRLQQKTAELDAYLQAKKIKATGGVVYAFYNPPWTLPLLRRNEVLIPISTPQK